MPPDEFLTPNQVKLEIEGLLKNIYELEEAERTLKQSGERFRIAFAQASVGMVMATVDGCIIEANQAYCALIGYAQEELRAMRMQSITHPDDQAANRELIRRLLDGEIPAFELEERHVKKAGGIVWVQASVAAVRDGDRRAINLIAFIQDRTKRRVAERVEMELNRLASVVEKTRDFIGICDPDLNVLFVNPAGLQLIGLGGQDDARSTRVTDYFFPEDAEHLTKVIVPTVLSEGTWSGELRLRHFRTREAIPVLFHEIFRIDDPGTGQPINFAAVARDMRERKRAEQQLQRSFDELRALTARLQSIREEERTRVAREIHDELGQALTAIKIDFASLTRELRMDQLKSDKAESILHLVNKTIESVRRISTELRPGILDDLGLVAALEWAAEEFEVRAGVKIHLDLPEDDILIDQERATALFRICQETLTNIVRHANATEVWIRLAQSNGEMFMEVHDNGKGVSDEQLSGGRSLGIRGMQERALLLGGDLTISTAPGTGTSVEVRIPKHDSR